MMLFGMVMMAAALLWPADVAAQQQPPGQESANLTLVYEREVFTYRGAGRRDPFRPLTGEDDLGPRFESLSLQGIIYATGRGRSVALIADSEGRVHRVRVGDIVGNSRVIEIGPLRVVMAVENFGAIRQEILELPTEGGTDR
ncbi:MAG: hypothetical protein ACOC3J_01420, partial [Gemmatimonadota bacterium]